MGTGGLVVVRASSAESDDGFAVSEWQALHSENWENWMKIDTHQSSYITQVSPPKSVHESVSSQSMRARSWLRFPPPPPISYSLFSQTLELSITLWNELNFSVLTIGTIRLFSNWIGWRPWRRKKDAWMLIAFYWQGTNHFQSGSRTNWGEMVYHLHLGAYIRGLCFGYQNFFPIWNSQTELKKWKFMIKIGDAYVNIKYFFHSCLIDYCKE